MALDDVCKYVTYKITFMIYISAYSNHLTLFAVLNIFFLINVDQSSDVRNSVFLNLAIVLDGLHEMVTWGEYSLIYPIGGCTAGQSVVRVQNLDTLDTNEPFLKGI